MSFFRDKRTGEVEQVSDILLPGNTPSRRSRAIAAHPDRYERMSKTEIKKHYDLINKELKASGREPMPYPAEVTDEEEAEASAANAAATKAPK